MEHRDLGDIISAYGRGETARRETRRLSPNHPDRFATASRHRACRATRSHPGAAGSRT